MKYSEDLISVNRDKINTFLIREQSAYMRFVRVEILLKKIPIANKYEHNVIKRSFSFSERLIYVLKVLVQLSTYVMGNYILKNLI